MSRRGTLLLIASWGPALAVLLGLGSASPAALLLVGLGALGVLVLLARERVHAGPAPAAGDVLCAVGLGLALAAAVVVGGYGAALTGRTVLRRAGTGWAVIAAAFAAALLRHEVPAGARRAFDRLLGAGPVSGEDRAAPPRHPLSWAIAPLGLLLHGAVLLAEPPLIQMDSCVNLMEPPFFEYENWFFHHPPVYVALVKLLGTGPHFLEGLLAIVALQHALVIYVLGFALERVVRVGTGSALAGALAGVAVVTEPHLALYAQLVMTETFAIIFAVAAAALLVEASRRPRAAPWLLVAGVSAGLGVLTRQALELWPGVVIAWLLVAGGVRPRRRAAAAFVAGTVLPIAAVVLHNHVFYDRLALTAATGRNVIYRICDGLPDLTDPAAPPGDETERARRLLWENRDRLWAGAYSAIREELGWTDVKIDSAMQRFYFEQVRRHPGPFARVTLSFAWTMLTDYERVAGLCEFHDQVRVNNLPPWDEIPSSWPAPPLLERYTALEPTSKVPLLVFAALAPLLARRRGRAVALLAVASAGYVIFLTALVEVPLFRYRLPAIPFLIVALAAGAVGLVERARRAPAGGAP